MSPLVCRAQSFSLWIASWLAVASPVLRAQPADTADLYAEWRERVVQVQVVEVQSQSKAGIGSGFFAAAPGLVLTNYHVISDVAARPGDYEARYLNEAGESGLLQLVAVDVVHDLAVLRSENLAPPPLSLAAVAPRKGSRVYAMGFPFDIGLTIVEGTFNGLWEKSLYERLHFTGSLNPGMSGGPALNPAGEVVGVNVSTAGNQVSFLVPVEFAAELLQQVLNDEQGLPGIPQQIATQLHRNQVAIADSLLAGPLQTAKLNGFRVPGDLAGWMSCWGNRLQQPSDPVEHVYYQCQSQQDIFLSDTFNTGIMRFQHDLLSAPEMQPLKFSRHLQRRLNFPLLRLEGDEQSVTSYRCQTDFLRQQGIDFQATFCLRGYRQYQGLYDAYLSLTSLAEANEALQSTLVLAGFSWENLQRLSSAFIEAIGVVEADG